MHHFVLAKWWNEKAYLHLESITESRSFTHTDSLVDDIYLKYTCTSIQFRVLHYRVFTNDVLVKSKVMESEICSICSGESDSNGHMLLHCQPKTIVENIEK